MRLRLTALAHWRVVMGWIFPALSGKGCVAGYAPAYPTMCSISSTNSTNTCAGKGGQKHLPDDVEFVYQRYLLGVRGQLHLEHYEGRLRMVLGDEGYGTALELLTEAAVNGGLLTGETIEQYRKALSSGESVNTRRYLSCCTSWSMTGIWNPHEGGFRFVSGLLEDWWRTRHREFFTPIAQR